MTDDPFEYLFSLEQFGIKLGLENIRTILAELDHPENVFASVHVAGTNGKGSVTAMVDSVLRAAGHRTARYTSPHLVDLAERFVVDGQAVTRPALESAIVTVRQAVADAQARGVLAVQPTFFEVTTAAAFELFRRASTEIAVCEAGLGGRLDATNVLSPVVCAITSIAFDHQQHLGTTLSAIAAEKAGIVKPGIPVVLGDMDEEAARVIAAIARDRGARVVGARETIAVDNAHADPDGRQVFTVRSAARHYGTLTLGLAGQHQIGNATVAIAVLEELDALGIRVSADAVARGLADVRWAGRLERIHLADGRTVLLDAAHNPSGAAALAAFLSRDGTAHPMVFAAMRDKDAAGMLGALAPVARAIILTRASTARSADPHDLAAVARSVSPGLEVHVEESLRDALEAAWRLDRHIVVAGSIFLLGDVMKELPSS